MTPFRVIWCDAAGEDLELLAGLIPDETIPGVLSALSRLRVFWPQLQIELAGRRVTRLDVLLTRDGRALARVMADVGE